MNDTVLRDEKAKIVTIADRDMVYRYLKHGCEDGEYTITGPGIDITASRRDGVVYPTTGTVDGKRLTPKTTGEAIEFFNPS